MIRSVNPLLINAETGQTGVVYMEAHDMVRQDKAFPEPTVKYTISRYILNAQGTGLILYRQTEVQYKLSTWMSIFGGLTANQMEQQKDQLFISQIDYVNNSHDWSGDELSIVRYWDTTSEDWQIVPQE